MSFLKPFATLCALRGVNMFGRCEHVHAAESRRLPVRSRVRSRFNCLERTGIVPEMRDAGRFDSGHIHRTRRRRRGCGRGAVAGNGVRTPLVSKRPPLRSGKRPPVGITGRLRVAPIAQRIWPPEVVLHCSVQNAAWEGCGEAAPARQPIFRPRRRKRACFARARTRRRRRRAVRGGHSPSHLRERMKPCLLGMRILLLAPSVEPGHPERRRRVPAELRRGGYPAPCGGGHPSLRSG